LHTVQTVGLALATDLAPEHARPRVVALLCAMLLLGMAVSALVFGLALSSFTQIRLIQVVQGAAVVTIVLNGIALWKQEPRSALIAPGGAASAPFRNAWLSFAEVGRTRRRLFATGLGTAAFSMQDILLEPYGGKILHLPVAATTAMTAMLAVGGGIGLVLAARWLTRGADAHRVAAIGAVIGVIAFAAVILSAPMEAAALFALGVTLIGLGAGMFAHGTLTATMSLAQPQDRGLALGAWGAAQATAAGVAIGLSGAINDLSAAIAASGALGEALVSPATGYAIVYAIEIVLLLATVVAIGPLVRSPRATQDGLTDSFNLLSSNGLSSGGVR
jgi:BCD family chlorophyll transporter-like MFS transporter